MEGDVLVLVQPFLHVWSCVGGEVVQYNVNGFSGMRLNSPLQEVKKISPVPGLLALAEDFPGVHVERGEQIGGAVPHVVVRLLRRLAKVEGQRRLGSVQRLDLCLLVDAEYDGATRRVQVQADYVGDFLGERGIPG